MKPADSAPLNRRRRTLSLALPAAACWGVSGRLQAADTIVIAVAAVMRFAMEDIVRQFTQETGIEVKSAIGSSGALLQQIRQGAPFQAYFSADEAFVNELARLGLTLGGRDDKGQRYAQGQLALAWKQAPQSGKPLFPLQNWREQILQVNRLAIANPEHAPYGQAALGWLERLGLLDAVRSKLVLGENVAQTAQYLATGAAPLGLIALSIAKAPQSRNLLSHAALADLPGNKDVPVLHQRMVLLKSASVQARRLFEYMGQDKARAVLLQHGFAV